LEAIVALTIMALALIPLISFISQAVNALLRAGDSNARSLAMQSALALMEPVNPVAEPQGQLLIDDRTMVTWDSELVVKPATGALIGSGLSSFRIGFYNVHVTLSQDGAPWFTFDMRKVGYDRIGADFSTGNPIGGGTLP
jgi:hypothetical protein